MLPFINTVILFKNEHYQTIMKTYMFLYLFEDIRFKNEICVLKIKFLESVESLKAGSILHENVYLLSSI